MEVLRDQNWLLSVGTFLPFAGVLVMLFIPKAEEELHKLVALVTAGATLAVGIYTLTQFDYDQAGELQFYAKTVVDRRHLQQLRDRPGRHQPAAVHPVDGGDVPRHHLFLEPPARAAATPSRSSC